jgi:hypothetical protein
MKNFLKLLGIIALVAVIGFSMVACDDGSDDGGGGGSNPFIGTWKSSNGYVMVFAASTFTITSANGSVESGSYTRNGNSASMTVSSGANFGQTFNVTISGGTTLSFGSNTYIKQ